jgi:hypothetical protein
VIRRLVAGLIVVGLAVGIWALWPRAGSDPTSTTLPVAAETTTTTIPGTTSTTVGASTTTDGSHVVTTVEEAEEILRALIYRRLLGIFQQDQEEIAQIVASESALDSAVQAFGRIDFEQEPSLSGVVLKDLEILRADEACLATWTQLDVTAFQGEGATSSAVVVLRRLDNEWKWASIWRFRDDLWEADCDSQLEPLY